MPTYDYICDECGHEFEAYESITSQSQTECPQCKKLMLRRKIGPGAAIIFKGSGFYQTDYRSDSYKKAAEADKSSSTSSEKPSAGSDKSSGGSSTSTSDGPAKSEPAKATTPTPKSES